MAYSKRHSKVSSYDLLRKIGSLEGDVSPSRLSNLMPLKNLRPNSISTKKKQKKRNASAPLCSTLLKDLVLKPESMDNSLVSRQITRSGFTGSTTMSDDTSITQNLVAETNGSPAENGNARFSLNATQSLINGDLNHNAIKKKKKRRKKSSLSALPSEGPLPELCLPDCYIPINHLSSDLDTVTSTVCTSETIAEVYNTRDHHNFVVEDTQSTNNIVSPCKNMLIEHKNDHSDIVNQAAYFEEGGQIFNSAGVGGLKWRNEGMEEKVSFLLCEEKEMKNIGRENLVATELQPYEVVLPMRSFMDEMNKGNCLIRTTTSGSEKERERVYDTIFRLPWRCELLIDIGFFVCLDSFLSLLTVMPARLVCTMWKMARIWQLKKLSPAELSDLGCFIVLISGVLLLQWTDISLIYHMIRGQGTIKLYVVYNVLEIFDKLCQSIGGDVLEALFNSAEGFAICSSSENKSFWTWRLASDQALAISSSIVHSFVLLVQAITLSTCIVAHNNALLALLVSNNFAEIKSNVFKRFNKDNIHSIAYSDSIERFHISAFLIFVLAQNILEAEGPWFHSFLLNALLVFFCEVLVDILKHSFLAKFNDIKPIVYSEFLEELCQQTLDIRTEKPRKNLTFVPLAPACVVIRVMTPVYACYLRSNWAWLRLFSSIVSCIITFFLLVALKLMLRWGLEKHAVWYINRCKRRRQHFHSD